MPIYDFKCRDCGRTSEIFVRTTEQEVQCPNCDSNNLEKLVTASYTVLNNKPAGGTTCCGREERCQTPQCSTGKNCTRD